MPYDRGCSAYWCDKCGRVCVMDWHNSGDVYFVLKCTKCPWTKIFVAQDEKLQREVEAGLHDDPGFYYAPRTRGMITHNRGGNH